MINIGDYVTRKSHGNDIIFKVINKSKNIYYLKGVEIRLCADSDEDDLIKIEKKDVKERKEILINAINALPSSRNNFFYIPGKVLHIDGDKDYLEKCMMYYKKAKVPVFGKVIDEEDVPHKINKLLYDINPDILVITGHDSYNFKTQTYKNSKSFVDAVRNARKYEKSLSNLVIISGACQSDYLSLMKAGSSFASSPNHVNIHALDPAIIASYISYTKKEQSINLEELLSKTSVGSKGIGGIRINGMMYEGYPRSEYDK